MIGFLCGQISSFRKKLCFVIVAESNFKRVYQSVRIPIYIKKCMEDSISIISFYMKYF